MRNFQIVLILYATSFLYANGLNVSLTLLVSNTSVLQTVQSARVIDQALQLGDYEGITITRKQEFDSMCDPNLGREETRKQSSNDVDQLEVIMDGSCSIVAEEVSQSSFNESIVMIFSSSSASINNDSVTMGTFRTAPSDRALPSAIHSLMTCFNWTQFSLVTSNSESQYTELKRLIGEEMGLETGEVNEDLNSDTVKVVEVDVGESSVEDSIEHLFDQQPHLYFLNTDIQTGVQFLCEGFKESRYYPNYLWILPSWWYQVGVSSQWWDDPSLIIGTRCSNMNEIKTVLDRALILRPIPANTTINEAVKFNTESIDVLKHSADSYAVDASLGLLFALNKTGPSTSHSELVSTLRNIQFRGISGYVSFDSNGDRADVMTMLQQIILTNNALSVVDIAYIENDLELELSVSEIDTVFPDGIPPDGTPIKSLKTIELGITIFVAFMTLIGLTLAIICLLFNIIFKDKKIVKLTSPKLNYFLIAGVITLLSGMIFYVIGTTNLKFLVFICFLRRLLVSTGHDIGFTVALVKTLRIYYIFKNPSPKKRAPKDSLLLLIAFGIVSVNAVISIILLVLDSIYNRVDFVEDREYAPITRENGVREEFCAPSCGTTIFYLVFLVFTMIFKITIHIIAIVCSFLIRKIVVDTLNDFKYTSVIVYTSTVLIVILVIVLVTTVSFINVYGAVVPFLVFIEVLVFLIFSFVPKMIALYKDPEGLRVMDKPGNKDTVSDFGAHGSLRKNVSLSFYNRKHSSIKEDEMPSDAPRTPDSKEHHSIPPKIPEVDEEKIEDSVFIEPGDEKESNGNLPAGKNEEKSRDETNV